MNLIIQRTPKLFHKISHKGNYKLPRIENIQPNIDLSLLRSFSSNSPMSHQIQFETDTKVHKIEDGRYSSKVHNGWANPLGTTFGGYVLSIGMSAMDEEFKDKSPSVASIRFIKAAEVGDVEILVSDVSHGKTLSSANAKITQRGKTLALIRATYSAPSPYDVQISRYAESFLEPTPPSDSVDALPNDPEKSKFLIKLNKKTANWFIGQTPSDINMQSCWARFSDGGEPDFKSLSFFGDVVPLACFDLKLPQPITFATTYELMVFFRKKPSKGWIRGQSTIKYLSQGTCDMDTEIFDEEGYLVCQAKQMMALKFGSKL